MFQKEHDILFLKRNAEYLRKLADRMQGLTIPEMQKFLVTENNRLVHLAELYLDLSRRGPTNDGLVRQIFSHQHQQATHSYRLFAVAGACHLDTNHNKRLQKILEPTALLIPKSFNPQHC